MIRIRYGRSGLRQPPLSPVRRTPVKDSPTITATTREVATSINPGDGCVTGGTLTGRPSATQHGEGEHEEGHDQGRDHPGPGEHAVVARSGARDRGIQIRRPRDGLLAQGRSGAQLQGFAVVPPWW